MNLKSCFSLSQLGGLQQRAKKSSELCPVFEFKHSLRQMRVQFPAIFFPVFLGGRVHLTCFCSISKQALVSSKYLRTKIPILVHDRDDSTKNYIFGLQFIFWFCLKFWGWGG